MEAREPVDDETYAALRGLAKDNPRVVCISEIGLDFLPESPPRNVQDQVFRAQIRLARELKLPIIFHSRESHPEVLRTLREERAYEVGGRDALLSGRRRDGEGGNRFRVPHLSGQTAAQVALSSQEVARDIPLESIVLETDAAPQPFKKYRRNWTEPRHVRDVAEKLAELKGITVEEVAQATTANLTRLLHRT